MLKPASNPKAVEGMTRFGISPENIYGVSVPNLRKMAKEIGKDHSLTQLVRFRYMQLARLHRSSALGVKEWRFKCEEIIENSF